MNVEIIAIADEILKGLVVNTNSSFLSLELTKLGMKVSRHTVLQDSHTTLLKGMEEALDRSDLVICTGGLGPTVDDITRSVAAELFQSEWVYDEATACDLIERFGPSLGSLKDQATVPQKAQILKNSVGTAPGFIFRRNEKRLVLLPGVPSEMKAMFEGELLCVLQKEQEKKEKLIHRTLFFCIINENRLDPYLRDLKKQLPSLDVGIYPGYGFLTVSLRAATLHDIDLAQKALVEPFASFHLQHAEAKVEHTLYHMLKARKETIAFAESCTGGLLAQKMTGIPGVSSVFLGSVVAYSNTLKQSALSVKDEALAGCGAVSAEVAGQMLDGLFSLIPADYGIAVTGIAGPSGGTEDKPVGTVWLAIEKRGCWRQLCRMRVRGSRELVMAITTGRALGALARTIEYGIMPFDFKDQSFEWLEQIV
jgi:nicotinamide-nucleotide amidase